VIRGSDYEFANIPPEEQGEAPADVVIMAEKFGVRSDHRVVLLFDGRFGGVVKGQPGYEGRLAGASPRQVKWWYEF